MNSKPIKLMLLCGLFSLPLSAYSEPALSLLRAVEIAQVNDPWLQRSLSQQAALDAKSISSSALPDPSISLGLMNFPVDTFDINQEPMTQIKMSVSQMFPRGDTRSLNKRWHLNLSDQQPFQRGNRREQVAVNVSLLWLDAYLARESIRLIESDRSLFEHLIDVSESSYSSAFGNTRQQDIVRAQLELTRLEDRLVMLQGRFDVANSRLIEWVGFQDNNGTILLQEEIVLVSELPDIQLRSNVILNWTMTEQEMMTNYFVHHPMIKAMDQQIVASQTGVELARQKYKPQWGVNASYGYRDDDRVKRADFLSVGIMFDLPLFTANRQDQDVKAAVSTSEAMKTDRILALRKMYAAYKTAKSRLIRLNDRQALYQHRLLGEMQEQAEASLTAYTRDDGDFSEVMRSRISELNARIDALSIDVQRLQSIVRLNYYLAPGAEVNSETPVNGDFSHG